MSTYVGEDLAALDAALAFIDEWDLDDVDGGLGDLRVDGAWRAERRRAQAAPQQHEPQRSAVQLASDPFIAPAARIAPQPLARAPASAPHTELSFADLVSAAQRGMRFTDVKPEPVHSPASTSTTSSSTTATPTITRAAATRSSSWSEDAYNTTATCPIAVDRRPRDKKKRHDDDDASSSRCIESTSTPSSTATQDPRALALQAVNLRVKRRRQKEELLELRAKVQQLEARLTTIQTAHAPTVGTSASSQQPPPPTFQHRSPLGVVWERLAARQLKERERVEIENHKLKQTLDEHVKLARSLDRILRKRATPQRLSPDGMVITPTDVHHEAQSDDTAHVQTLVVDLEALYRAIDAIAERFGLTNDAEQQTTAFRETKLQTDVSSTSAFLESMDRRVLPFDMESTSATVWQFLADESGGLARIYYQNCTNMTDDIRTCTYGIEMQHKETKAAFWGTSAMRKYVENGRIVISWSGQFEPVNACTGSLDSASKLCGFVFRHKGWVDITPLAATPQNAVVMQSYYRIEPELVETTDARGESANAKISALMDFVIRTTDARLDAHHQFIENNLMLRKPESLSAKSSATCARSLFIIIARPPQDAAAYNLSADVARVTNVGSSIEMNVMDDISSASVVVSSTSNGNAATDVSLEEALAFFDCYDDQSLQRVQPQQQQQHLTSMGAGAGNTNGSAHVHATLQQQQHEPYGIATATDILMMIDDASVVSDGFALDTIANNSNNNSSAFLYSAASATVAPAQHALQPLDSPSAMAVDAMRFSSSDFGLMATLLQPLHLDEAPATPRTAESSMQSLLTAPLPTAPAPSTATTNARDMHIQLDPPKHHALSATTRSSPTTTAAKPKASTLLSTTIGSVASTTNPPTTNRSSTKRVRRQKEELLYLRSKVIEMEARLAQLKRVNRESVPGSTTSDSPAAADDVTLSHCTTLSRKRRSDDVDAMNDESDPDKPASPIPAIAPALLASVWENVAERQYKERLRAEQQNKKLKLMLESQIKLASSLEKILKKRPTAEVLAPASTTKPTGAQRVIAYNETDTNVFAQQRAAADDAYLRTDSVFRACDFFATDANNASLPSTRHDFRVKDVPDANGVIMEFMATMVVPFDVATTGNALWRFLSDVGVRRHCYFEQVVEATDEFVARSFGVRIQENNQDVDLRGKHTIRKFVDDEKKRIVLVWTSHMEPLKLADAPVAGLRFNDIGWLVVTSCGGSKSTATVINVFGNLSPLIPDSDESEDDDTCNDRQADARIGALTDFVINSHEHNAALCLKMINDLLVEEAWKSVDDVAL